MSLREIVERTGYSLSHVSSALKFLERIGLVTGIKKPGDRKAYYTSTKNLQDWRREAYYRKVDVKEMRESLLKALAELEGGDESEDEILETISERLKRRARKNPRQLTMTFFFEISL